MNSLRQSASCAGKGRVTADYPKSLCPNCCVSPLWTFYRIRRVPVHSVLLFDSREAAVNYPKGDVELAACPNCSFVSNVRFDASLHEYSARYEETQGFSGTFRAFHERLADSLIERYRLHGKRIVEIGCGKGEFLTLLCDRAGATGLGFDPAYVEGRLKASCSNDVRFIRDFYSEKYRDLEADFVCCKMTLEHIANPASFLETVRRALGERSEAAVFFQVPNAERIWRTGSFWDVYYEHCSYFTKEALARLFERCDFDVMDLWTEYEDQYLAIAATPGKRERKDNGRGLGGFGTEKDSMLASFGARVDKRVGGLREMVRNTTGQGGRAVVWGAGSKAVSFLGALGEGHGIGYAVDINPFRQGTFLSGGGERIVPPSFLTEYQPDLVVVMNGVYEREIRGALTEMGLSPVIASL